MHLHLLAHTQIGESPATDSHIGFQPELGIVQLHIQPIHTLQIPLQHDRLTMLNQGLGGLPGSGVSFEDQPIPLPTQEHLLSLGQLSQPAQPAAIDASGTDHEDAASQLPDFSSKRGTARRCPQHTGRPDLPIGANKSTDPRPIAHGQTRQIGRLLRLGDLSHQRDVSGFQIERRDGANHGVEHINALRTQAFAALEGLQCHDLTNGQHAGVCSHAVLPNRCVGRVLNLQSVDTDARKTSDHAHDPGASQTALGRNLPCASDAARIGTCHAGCPGTANAPRERVRQGRVRTSRGLRPFLIAVKGGMATRSQKGQGRQKYDETAQAAFQLVGHHSVPSGAFGSSAPFGLMGVA